MTSAFLRLTLPVTLRPSRERLHTVVPRHLWPKLQKLVPPARGVDAAGPLLLGFHGTGFMEDCFKWLSCQVPLPPQSAWRDWCEPPAAMLTPGGQAAYPKTIQRGTCWGLNDDKGGEDVDLASFGVLDGPPAWLRKLYLPQHDRFTVVVLELICLAAGWPPLDRHRVKEAGLVVRRLRPGDSSGDEQWEDWIAMDQRLGSWQLPLKLWEVDPGRDPASRPGLTSQPLALAPATLEGMGPRCVLHGYLSLATAQQEVPVTPLPVETRAKAADQLKKRATAQLQALGAAAPATEWLPPATPLRELLVDTVLSGAPDDGEVAGARAALQGAISTIPPLGVDPNSFPSNELLDLVLEQALRVLIVRALDGNRFAKDVAGNVISGEDLWSGGGAGSSVVADGLKALRAALQNPVRPPPGELGIGAPSDWDVLVRDRLHRVLDAWIQGQPLPIATQPLSVPPEQLRVRFRDALLPALLAVTLVRARGCRLALIAAMNLAQGETTADLDRPEAGSAPPPPRQQPRARHSLGDLGEGLESFLATERERGSGSGLAPWVTFKCPANAERLERVDRNLRALAEHYAPFEAQLAEAGAEVRFELEQRAETLETKIGSALNELRLLSGQAIVTPGIPSLLERGLDLLEPPATGLLLLPGLGDGLADRLSAFTTAVAKRYDDANNAQPEAEALVAGQLRRPRFDSHHIYAVQAWVRVSGRAPGEAERVIWSPRSEPFVLAEPTDLLGSQPMAVPLPDLPRLLRDLSRLRKAGANPFLTLVPPPRSGAESTGGGLEDLRRDLGMGTAVSLVTPVLAVVGLGMLSSALRIFSRLPGFAWMRQVVIRTPAPERRP